MTNLYAGAPYNERVQALLPRAGGFGANGGMVSDDNGKVSGGDGKTPRGRARSARAVGRMLGGGRLFGGQGRRVRAVRAVWRRVFGRVPVGRGAVCGGGGRAGVSIARGRFGADALRRGIARVPCDPLGAARFAAVEKSLRICGVFSGDFDARDGAVRRVCQRQHAAGDGVFSRGGAPFRRVGVFLRAHARAIGAASAREMGAFARGPCERGVRGRAGAAGPFHGQDRAGGARRGVRGLPRAVCDKVRRHERRRRRGDCGGRVLCVFRHGPFERAGRLRHRGAFRRAVYAARETVGRVRVRAHERAGEPARRRDGRAARDTVGGSGRSGRVPAFARAGRDARAFRENFKAAFAGRDGRAAARGGFAKTGGAAARPRGGSDGGGGKNRAAGG